MLWEIDFLLKTLADSFKFFTSVETSYLNTDIGNLESSKKVKDEASRLIPGKLAANF